MPSKDGFVPDNPSCVLDGLSAAESSNDTPSSSICPISSGVGSLSSFSTVSSSCLIFLSIKTNTKCLKMSLLKKLTTQHVQKLLNLCDILECCAANQLFLLH